MSRATGFRATEVKIRLKRIIVSRFARAHDGTAFEAPTRLGRQIIVHRCPLRADRKWRLTYFDHRGPAGHCYAEDYRAACELAAWEFTADLSRATFAAWSDP